MYSLPDRASFIKCDKCFLTGRVYTVYTTTEFEYSFVWLRPTYQDLVFKVKAGSDVHVALSTVQGTKDGYEVVIGGWDNSQSVIRTEEGHVAEEQTPNILNADQFRYFWISWDSNDRRIKAGTGSAVGENTFIELQDDFFRHINAIGLATGYGYAGTYEFQDIYGKQGIHVANSFPLQLYCIGQNVPLAKSQWLTDLCAVLPFVTLFFFVSFFHQFILHQAANKMFLHVGGGGTPAKMLTFDASASNSL